MPGDLTTPTAAAVPPDALSGGDVAWGDACQDACTHAKPHAYAPSPPLMAKPHKWTHRPSQRGSAWHNNGQRALGRRQERQGHTDTQKCAESQQSSSRGFVPPQPQAPPFADTHARAGAEFGEDNCDPLCPCHSADPYASGSCIPHTTTAMRTISARLSRKASHTAPDARLLCCILPKTRLQECRHFSPA